MSDFPLKPMFSKPLTVAEDHGFTATVTEYPWPKNKEPFSLSPDGVFEPKAMRVVTYFGTRTARAWRKPTRRWKKQQWMTYRNGRKEMQRLRNKAQGFPVFRCACCCKGFIGGLTVREARAQYAAEFHGEEWSPNLPLVCADCFEDVGSQEQRDAWAARGEP